MRVISLGWGVQSFTLTAMVALGELPPIDVAIHADTTYERTATREFAERWTPWLEARNVRIVTVRPAPQDLLESVVGKGVVPMPLYTISLKGTDGQIKRQCTGDWKIAPMRRWLQRNRHGATVEQWIGISIDEAATRIKPSDVKYIKHVWPLSAIAEEGIEPPVGPNGFLHMTRSDCKAWLESRGLEIPPRSACTFCPFHNAEEWRQISRSEDWPQVLAVDEDVRDRRPKGGKLYLTPARKPLASIDFRSAEELGQMSLWDNECSGVCGI